MKLAVPIGIALLLTLSGVVITTELSGAGPAAPAPSGQASELLATVAAAYRAAPALTDTVKMQYKGRSAEQTYTSEIALGSGHRARVAMSGYVVTALDESIYVALEANDQKFVEAPIQSEVASAYRLATGTGLPVQLALRWSESADDHVAALGLGLLQSPRLAPRYDLRQTAGGADAYEVILEAQNGSARVFVDPATNLLLESDVTYTMTRGRATRTVEMHVDYEPRVHGKLADPIAFGTAGRYQVGSVAALKTTNVGEPAPDFTLTALGGETVTLSDLRGSVVVLDFWATWCGPCRRGLPLLQQFHTWAESSGRPIKVFAVDVWEKQSTEEAKVKVSSYWKQSRFTMPMLFDLESKAVTPYGFTSIPHTVVIDPDGKVSAIHRGFSANMVSMLKRDAEQALGAE